MSEESPSQGKALRHLFLLLFVRGHAGRGQLKEVRPQPLIAKLKGVLLMYALFGLLCLFLTGTPTFSFAVYLHAMTFLTLGMFLSVSAGETLFNKEEADILLHRPIDPKTLLWAKISVLVQVSFYLAAAFNLAGLVAGAFSSDGSWLFPFIHLVSTATEALFSAGCVVLVYELCAKWIGRERLEGVLTTAQVIVMVAITASSQIVSREIGVLRSLAGTAAHIWWVKLMPPAWFAGMDDAVAGSHSGASWVLAGIGLLATGVTLWLAFVRLADSYQSGMQTIGERAGSKPKDKAQYRWLQALADMPPMCWFLRDPVARSSFLLVGAYLSRDRETKLRVFPGLAPYVVMPITMMFADHGGDSSITSFSTVFVSSYLSLIPVTAYRLLKYSQQYRAADSFRAAPLDGPFALCDGARMAVMLLLTMPLMLAYAIYDVAVFGFASLTSLLPCLIALPVFSHMPLLGERTAPLSAPMEQAKSAGRAFSIYGALFGAMALAGVAVAAKSLGFYWAFLIVEFIGAVALTIAMRVGLRRVRWLPEE